MRRLWRRVLSRCVPRKTNGESDVADWSDERAELVTKLWHDGFSASQIATRLGVTRNAVIGKVRRLKLPFRSGHGTSSGWGRAKSGDLVGSMGRGRRGTIGSEIARLDRAVTDGRHSHERHFLRENCGSIVHELARAQIEHGPDLVVPPAERRTLADLEPGDCRWPFGDPGNPDFHYCNRMAVGAPDRLRRGVLPYCDFHAKRAYRPVAVARSMAEVGNPMAFHHKGSTGVSTKELAEFDLMTVGE